MKLKNKKTGDIWEFDGGFSMIASHETAERAGGRGCSVGCYVKSLAELNEEWEDYKPAEPLIKDEKIRRAVRAWAEANDFLDEIEVHTLTAGTRFSLGHYDIEFIGYFIYDLEANKTYTITELCGEEEE